MGYMGFGMRKEVYTRKPKEAFKRIKKLLKPQPKTGNASGYEASKVYHKTRFKTLGERRWFQVIRLLATLFLLWFIAELFIVDSVKQSYQAYQFRKKGISTFYEEHKAPIDKIISFVAQQNEKLASIPTSRTLILRSENYFENSRYEPADRHRVNYDYSYPPFPEIIEGNITFKKGDHLITYDKYWTCKLYIANTSYLSSSVLSYLNTTKVELNTILRFIEEQNFSITTGQEGFIINFHKYGKAYTLVVSEDIERIKQKRQNKRFLRLKENLYYTNSRINPEVLN